MEYPVRKVVMTGGSGPVGLALIRKLLKENVEILLFQRENSAKKIYLPEDPLLHIEFYDLEHLKEYTPTGQEYDVFFHLGWENTGKRENIQDQYMNVVYACDAVELAHKMGCHSFIGAGSQAEYGRHDEALCEDTLCTPENAYGVMKLSACYATRNLCRKYSIRHIWPRILSGYGIYDNPSSMLISTILNSMDGKILLFSAGDQVWDFVYLDDIANALFLIARRGRNGAEYPIGSGNARPLKEYIKILCDKLGKLEDMQAGMGKIPYTDSNIMYLEADISSLQADTGWVPEVTFEDGIVKVIDFYRGWKIKWEKKFWDIFQKYEEKNNEIRGEFMKKNNYYQRMTEIYKRLQDEESKSLFEARISFLLNQDQSEYMETIGKLYHDWYPLAELEEKVSITKPKGIIIFGCGHAGKMICRMLSFWKYETSFFCDNYKNGQMFEGKVILSVKEVAKKYKDYLVIISSYNYGEEMKNQLIQEGFSDTNILLSKSRILVGVRGKQYFDVLFPQEDEVYVDAGTFDGKTVLDFCEWSNGNYKKIYVFEPMGDMCEVIRKKLEEKKISGVDILNNAAWDKNEEIHFTEDGSGSCINSNGEVAVQGLDIDSAVKDEKVTFIKMDVEGSELKALQGAKNTIINNRPRLAICIYHKPIDVIEIASYILELVPEYKFYIRHYTSHMWETVLYAVL